MNEGNDFFSILIRRRFLKKKKNVSEGDTSADEVARVVLVVVIAKETN